MDDSYVLILAMARRCLYMTMTPRNLIVCALWCLDFYTHDGLEAERCKHTIHKECFSPFTFCLDPFHLSAELPVILGSGASQVGTHL